MRILITGANGFVGSHVAELLAAQGHSLRLLLRRTSSLAFLDGVSGYERAEGDVRDSASLDAAVAGVEAVVHLAGLTTALTESHYQAVNALGTAELVRAATAAGVRRFVYVSTLAAQGPSADGRSLAPEVTRPNSAYGRSKLAGEWPALAAKDSMSVAIVRPPVVYGPRDNGLLEVYKIAARGVFPVLGDGSNQVTFVHVLDAAEAICAVALAEGPSGAIYTISDGEAPHTWRELLQAFDAARGKRTRIIATPPSLYKAVGYAAGLATTLTRRPLPLSPAKVEQMLQRYWVCDHEAITRDLGWTPKIGIEAGMADTYRWCRERGWL